MQDEWRRERRSGFGSKGGIDRERERDGEEERSVWSVKTQATLSLIVLLSPPAPKFTTSLEHEKHSKLKCGACAHGEMDIFILDFSFLKSAFQILSQRMVKLEYILTFNCVFSSLKHGFKDIVSIHKGMNSSPLPWCCVVQCVDYDYRYPGAGLQGLKIYIK